jgi:hypothetical protein
MWASKLDRLAQLTFSVTAGIEAATSTVTVSGVKHLIDLHSPLPDAAITDYKEALNTLGGLGREPAGVIRTFESFQLHLAYSWHTLMSSLADLRARW